jgi:hypothetical protein
MTPHLPYRHRGEVTERLLEARGVPGPWPEAIHNREQVGDNPDERMQAMVRAYYDAEVETLDQEIGALMSLLAERTSRDTWLILTSDHGEELFEHGGFEHGHSLHEEVLRVPLLLRPPGKPIGDPVESPVSLLDIAPTLLDLAGLPGEESTFGRSLLASDPPSPRLLAASGVLYGPPEEALLLGSEKRLREGDRVRSYDLATDPNEADPRPSSPGEFEAHWRLVQHLDATHQAVLDLSSEEALLLSVPTGCRVLLLDPEGSPLQTTDAGVLLPPGETSLIIEGWTEDRESCRLGPAGERVEIAPPWLGPTEVRGESGWAARWRVPTHAPLLPASRREALEALGYVGP